MVQHDELHLQARVRAVELYFKHNEQLPAAAAAFEPWNAAHPDHQILGVRNFIKRSVDKLRNHFTLMDLTGGGRPHKLPHEAALRAIRIVAEGYMQERSGIDGGVVRFYYEHKRFTSLSEAIMLSGPLRALMQEYDVSHDYLLNRLHDVEPYLEYGHMPMKLMLTHQQMLARQQYCIRMLSWLQADPWLLHKIFWADECRIWYNKDLYGRLKVWYDRRDLEGHPPESHPDFSSRGAKRIDVFLIVNAFVGCVYVEFLTGTTDIEVDGRYNPGMRQQMALRAAAGVGGYKTVRSRFTEPAKSATAEEIADDLECGYIPWRNLARANGWQPLLSVDNPNVHTRAAELMGIPNEQIVLPKYSPDLHQVIEHRFGPLKLGIVNQLYRLGWEAVTAGGMGILRQMVVNYCKSITPAQIQNELPRLVECYKVVACNTTESVLINGRMVQGVGGGRPPKHFS